jgi:hypothetical protein
MPGQPGNELHKFDSWVENDCAITRNRDISAGICSRRTRLLATKYRMMHH